MMSLEEAQGAIFRAIRSAGEMELVPLEQAHGRYCSEVLAACVDNPAFDNSAMDGYAFNVADARGRNFVLPLKGVSSCGDAPSSLAPGTAMRIFTGAPLPAGADAIAIQEDASVTDGQVRLPSSIATGDHVRHRGEDYRAGDALYPLGTRLSALDLALLATAGNERVAVYRRPRALIAATGNELVTPGRSLAAGQIYESNRLALNLQLRANGVEVTDAGIVPDDPAALRTVLKQGAEFDFVITTGGASVGDHDLIQRVFGEVGVLHLWKVRIKPGKPIAFGHIGARAHFFALPGNPLSSLVTYKLFVEPALAVWHHATPYQWQLTATAVNGYRRVPGRTEFVRARLTSENGELRAEALRGQGSHMIGTLRSTNGFIRVEAEATGFSAGETVRVMPLQSFDYR